MSMSRVYKLLVCPECRSQLYCDHNYESYCCNKFWLSPNDANSRAEFERGALEITAVEVKRD